MSVLLESASAVLVIISSTSVSICNSFYARLVDSSGNCAFGRGYPNLNYGTFVPTYFHSIGGTFTPWNFRSMELSFPGTFDPMSQSQVELSLREGKMAWNFCSPCPKIVVATNCTHGAQWSQDVIPCRRPVEACRPTRLMQRSEAILSRNRSSWNHQSICRHSAPVDKLITISCLAEYHRLLA